MVLVFVLLIVAVCMSLWGFQFLRPLLAGFGAGIAAFLAPLPGLMTPESRGKWLVAIGLACLIGLGTWYSSDAIERERDHLERKTAIFESAIRALQTEGTQKLVLVEARDMRDLFNQRQFEPVFDRVDLLRAIDHENGHALYFRGELYRVLRQRTDMRGAFREYLQLADHYPEALVGDARQCYLRPTGYCAERTEWISHLLAQDFLNEGRTCPRDRAAGVLGTAFYYEGEVLKMRPQGFDPTESIESSCQLLHGIVRELSRLGQRTADVEVALNRYRVRRHGLCN
jgi:hypothetical protein